MQRPSQDDYARYLSLLNQQYQSSQTSSTNTNNSQNSNSNTQQQSQQYINTNPGYSTSPQAYYPQQQQQQQHIPVSYSLDNSSRLQQQQYTNPPNSYQLPVVTPQVLTPTPQIRTPYSMPPQPFNQVQYSLPGSYNNSNTISPPVSAPYEIPVQQPKYSTDKDAEIARVLQEVERARFEKERQQREAMERLDEQMAKKLVLEEGTTPTPIHQSTRRLDEGYAYSLQRQEMLEEEQRRREEEQRRLNTLKDEELARRLALEEQKAIQLQKDKKLAQELQRQEDALRNQYSYNTYSTPSYTNVKVTAKKRRHALNIHNRYCTCGNTQTYNNNHIFEIHAKHCTCNASYQGRWNEGRRHTHDHRCCSMNHIHTIRCYCVKRNHTCGSGCCQKYHVHTATCHCVAK